MSLKDKSVAELRIIAGWDEPKSHFDKGLKSAYEEGKNSHKKEEQGALSKVGKYAAMIPRGLAASPGYLSDLANLPLHTIGRGVHKVIGIPYQESEGAGAHIKQAVDSATKNYAKPTSDGEKVWESAIDALGFGRVTSAKSLAGKIGKTVASKVAPMSGAAASQLILNDNPENWPAALVTGIMTGAIPGITKAALNKVAHSYRAMKIPYVKEALEKNISKKSGADYFDDYTHEKAGKPLSRKESIDNTSARASEGAILEKELEELQRKQAFNLKHQRNDRSNQRSSAKSEKEKVENNQSFSVKEQRSSREKERKSLKEELRRIENNQRFEVQNQRKSRQQHHNLKRENEGNFYSPEEQQGLGNIYQTQAEPLGYKLYEAARKLLRKQDLQNAKKFKILKRDVANIPKGHTEDMSHMVRDFYDEIKGIDNSQILKDALNSEIGSNIRKLMNLPSTFKKTTPETQRLLIQRVAEGKEKLSVAVPDLTASKRSLKVKQKDLNTQASGSAAEVKHVAANVNKGLDNALNQVPGAVKRAKKVKFEYGKQKSTVTPHINEVTVEGIHLPETALVNSLKTEAGKGANKVQAITKALGKKDAEKWVDYHIAEMGNKGNKFDETTFINNFLQRRPTEQKALIAAASPRTAKVLEGYSNPNNNLEKVRAPVSSYKPVGRSERVKARERIKTAVPEYKPVNRSQRQKARENVNATSKYNPVDRKARFDIRDKISKNATAPRENTSPSTLFREHKQKVLSGQLSPKGDAPTRGIIRDMAQGQDGNFDLNALNRYKATVQPEVWKKLEAKLPKEVVHKLEEGTSKLSQLERSAAKPRLSGVPLKLWGVRKAAPFLQDKWKNNNKAGIFTGKTPLEKIEHAFNLESSGKAPTVFSGKGRSSYTSLPLTQQQLSKLSDNMSKVASSDLANKSIAELRKIAGWD